MEIFNENSDDTAQNSEVAESEEDFIISNLSGNDDDLFFESVIPLT